MAEDEVTTATTAAARGDDADRRNLYNLVDIGFEHDCLLNRHPTTLRGRRLPAAPGGPWSRTRL